jgi:hypothetical protein
MKALKWIAIGLVGLIVLVVGGVFVALSTIDPNQYKPQIVEAAKNATGRDLALKGDIKLGIGFNPTFSIADVTLSNASWGTRPEMVKVGRFEVQVALLPLLSKQVDVKRLILLDTDILLETDRQGRGNWEFAPPTAQPQQQRPAQQQQQQASGAAMPLPVVREVELRNLRFAFRDGRTNETTSALLEKVLLNADSASSPLKLDIAGSANAAPFGELKFALAGTICSVERLVATSGSPCALDLTARLADVVTARVRGGIVAPTQGRGLDINLGVDVPDLVKLGQLLKQDIPGIGPVKVEAQLTDGAPQNRPSIPRLSVNAGAAETILVAITGAIADPTNEPQRGVRLNVKADSRDLAGLFRVLKQDAPVAGPLAFEATIARARAQPHRRHGLAPGGGARQRRRSRRHDQRHAARWQRQAERDRQSAKPADRSGEAVPAAPRASPRRAPRAAGASGAPRAALGRSRDSQRARALRSAERGQRQHHLSRGPDRHRCGDAA